MNKITIGTVLDTKHGRAKVTGIDLHPLLNTTGIICTEPIEMTEIWESLKDYCIFDLDNGHWAYGDEVTVVNQ